MVMLEVTLTFVQFLTRLTLFTLCSTADSELYVSVRLLAAVSSLMSTV